VAIGHVTWNVAIDELIPQLSRVPDDITAQPSAQPKGSKPAPLRPLEDFEEE